MANFDDVFERIKQTTNTRTQVELAAVLDIRQSSISDAKRRNSVPSDWYMKLFERYGLNPEWLKRGTGPMYIRTDGGYAPAGEGEELQAQEEAAPYGLDDEARGDLVSVYSMQDWPETSGGNLPQVKKKLLVPRFLMDAGIRVFSNDAAGMEPLILRGAYVGLDTTRKHIVSGEMFGVRLPYEGVSIKRVFMGAGGTAILRAENPGHPEITLSMPAWEESCIGRVVWVLNRY